MKKKNFLIVLLAAFMVFSLSACGGANNALVGTWQLTDGEAAEYGWGLKFNKDGTMTFATGGDEKSQKEMDEAFESLQALYKIKYKVKSDTKMEITMSAFMGMAKESNDVEYTLDGDTLVFDGATYTRIKK